MFPSLVLAHRHLKLIHRLFRAAVLTSTDEFQEQRQLIEISFHFFFHIYFPCSLKLFRFSVLASQLQIRFSFQK